MEGSVQNNYTLLRRHICYKKTCQHHPSYSFFSSDAPLVTTVHAKCTQICNADKFFRQLFLQSFCIRTSGCKLKFKFICLICHTSHRFIILRNYISPNFYYHPSNINFKAITTLFYTNTNELATRRLTVHSRKDHLLTSKQYIYYLYLMMLRYSNFTTGESQGHEQLMVWV